jgi:regulator of sirC expression with transglutaminase-like and TPR domain
MNYLELFAQELRKEAPAPERLALAIATIAYEQLDIEKYLEQLDALAAHVGERVLCVPLGLQRAQELISVLHGELGFIGNRQNYYVVTNSFLNDVIDKRTGLPILLSLVYVAIGSRLGLRVEGIGFPNHFMVRYTDTEGSWLLDPFHGQLIDPDDAESYLSQLMGRTVRVAPEMQAPVSSQAFVQRILNNLRVVYLGAGNFEMAIRVLDCMLVLAPGEQIWLRERALAYARSEYWVQAVRDIRRYFFLGERFELLLPQPDESVSFATLPEDERHLFSILQQGERLLARMN